MPELQGQSIFKAGVHQAALILAQIAEKLPHNGYDDPRRDARHLLALAIKRDDPVLPHEDVILDDQAILRLDEVIERRKMGEPISRIKGMREFYGLDFKIDHSTLDPRADSEVIVDTVIDYVNESDQSQLNVVDFGTGSGCLILAAAYNCPNIVGIGVDIQVQAINIAKANADNLHLSDRISFKHSKWDDEIDGVFDIVISNPPYIPSHEISGLMDEVRKYDPAEALDGGEDGLDAWRALSAITRSRLTKTGIAVFEIGQGQEDNVVKIMQDHGLLLLEERADLAGIIRCLVFRIDS